MCRLLFATEISRGFGKRSYVSGVLIGSQAVALMGLRTRRGLISGKVRPSTFRITVSVVRLDRRKEDLLF
jgi:hypothetical protein